MVLLVPLLLKGYVHEFPALRTHGGQWPEFTTLLISSMQWPRLSVEFIGWCNMVTIVLWKHRFAPILAIHRSTAGNFLLVSYV